MHLGGAVYPPGERVGTGGLTHSCPTAPHYRQRTVNGMRSEPFRWVIRSASGGTVRRFKGMQA